MRAKTLRALSALKNSAAPKGLHGLRVVGVRSHIQIGLRTLLCSRRHRRHRNRHRRHRSKCTHRTKKPKSAHSTQG